MKYKSNHNVVYSCKYHVVWCPKYRRSVLANGVDVRLKELIKETCDSLNVEIIEMEIMPNHVHLLMEVDPQFGVHKAVKQIKGYFSKVLRTEFSWLKSRLPTLWTNSCFVSTVGGDSACSNQTIHRESEKCVGTINAVIRNSKALYDQRTKGSCRHGYERVYQYRK